MDHFIQSVSTGSLLIFSFFMITDPKTIPNHTVARILWAGVIAAIAFYLTAFRFINGAPIFVLVFAQLFVPLLDKFFKAKKFEWNAQPTYTENGPNKVYENQSGYPCKRWKQNCNNHVQRF